MLTDLFLKQLKPEDKPKKYADFFGLFIYVTPAGKKYWRMAYRYNPRLIAKMF